MQLLICHCQRLSKKVTRQVINNASTSSDIFLSPKLILHAVTLCYRLSNLTISLTDGNFLKVWWHDATLFLFIFHILYTVTYIHSLTFIQYIYPSSFAEASLLLVLKL
jgi:hypothetical protein